MTVRMVGNSLIGLATLLVATLAQAGALVIAPHPDDDILMASGVVRRAVGFDEVTVVFMTNGDYSSKAEGHLRQTEAVDAQVNHLGTLEDNLIFLGYPDGQLERIYTLFSGPTDQYFTSFGQGTTYGSRGLGRSDYHTYRFGSPAPYNRPNIVSDLASVIATYRPDQIYTTSSADRHSDHASTYRYVKDALNQVRATDPTYAPVLNTTIIWSIDSSAWPTGADPSTYHSETPDSHPLHSRGRRGRASTCLSRCRLRHSRTT